MTDFGRRALPHAAAHQDGGDDEISVEALSGELADEQDAGKFKGVTVDNADIGDDKLLQYKSGTGNIEYEDPAQFITDHGELTGLDDDHHSHYHNNARGDARYVPIHNVLTNRTLAWDYKTIIAGTWELALNSDYIFFCRWYNATGAQNDEIEYEIFAEAGAKTFELIARTGVDRGILTVYLDDVSQGTIDQYNASPSWLVTFTLAVTVVGSKMHSLKLKAATKNGSSSGYYVIFSELRIK